MTHRKRCDRGFEPRELRPVTDVIPSAFTGFLSRLVFLRSHTCYFVACASDDMAARHFTVLQGRGDEKFARDTSVWSDVVPGSIPPGRVVLPLRFTHEGGATHQSPVRPQEGFLFALAIHARGWCYAPVPRTIARVRPRSSRSRRPSARDQAGPLQSSRRSRTRHPKTRRHSRCRHARVPASWHRAGCR